MAPQAGTARQALLHNDVLFGISDNAIQTFDISDRDQPTQLDRVDVAHDISQVKAVGDKLLRFGRDWWTNEPVLELAPLDDAGAVAGVPTLDLSAPINIPGEVLHYDHALGRVITLDPQRVLLAENISFDECYSMPADTHFEENPGARKAEDYHYSTALGTCSRTYQSINSLLIENDVARRM